MLCCNMSRMTWLLEILGPQGLAMAAGVARGLCDPHAGEPAHTMHQLWHEVYIQALSEAGNLAVAWMLHCAVQC